MATSEQKNGDQPDEEQSERPVSERKLDVKILLIHCADSLF
ncbi:hypothetical protein ACFEN4_004772 [Salmonella enterica]|nr:hypothetical protein [Salmonella enterica]